MTAATSYQTKMHLFSTSKLMSVLNQSISKVYSEHDWMEAQIMGTWNPKIIFGASAETLRNSVLLLLHIWHQEKPHSWLCCQKSSLLGQKKHTPVNCTKISQLMTSLQGKKDLEDTQEGMCPKSNTQEQGPEAEIFDRHNLLWRKFRKQS